MLTARLARAAAECLEELRRQMAEAGSDLAPVVDDAASAPVPAPGKHWV